MSLKNTLKILSDVVKDRREENRVRTAKRVGRHRVYCVNLPIGDDGRTILTRDVIEDILFEDSIVDLSARERRIARGKWAIVKLARAYDSGRIVSFEKYYRKRREWPEINQELYAFVESIEKEREAKSAATERETTETAKVAETVKAADEAPTPDVIPVAPKVAVEPTTSKKAEKTFVEEFLEEIADPSIRGKVDAIFANDPELRALANSQNCTLRIHISEDGEVSVGSGLLKAQNA